ncbi:MAG: class I SAM-dependent methyltransferase [Dehalococcoidia bacterium]
MIEPIDWLKRWHDTVVERRDQADRWRGKTVVEQDSWAAQVGRFRELTAGMTEDETFFAALRAAARPDDTILDIGAGAGRYALTIAPYVRRVIALEPSAGMCEALRLGIADRGLTNVEVVQAAWPSGASQVEPADITICAHAMYWAEEIGPFLTAIDEKTRRQAMLTLRVYSIEAWLGDLPKRLRGETRIPEPIALDLVGALTAVGIWPNLTIVDGFLRSYGSLDELTESVVTMLVLSPDDAPRDFIREQVRPLASERGGRLYLDGPWRQAGIVEWTKR